MAQIHADILKQVIAFLREGHKHSTFICDLVSKVRYDEYVNCDYHHVNAIRYWISQAIDKKFSYVYWLQDIHPDVYCVMSSKDIQDARIQWCEWMIENNQIFDEVL